MSDFTKFFVSVGASIVASLIALNLDKIKKYRPSRPPRKVKMSNRIRQKEFQRSHPTMNKHPLSRR